MILTSLTPDIVRHFESNDEDTQVNLLGPLSEGMGAQELIETSFGGVIVGRVVLVLTLTLSLEY